MARAVTIGNGNLLVGIDDRGHVRDFYYPFVGHTNHVSGGSGSYTHRIGVWVDGILEWLSDESWDIRVGCHEATATSDIHAENEMLGITLHITDAVHNEKDIFLRKVTVTNNREQERNIRVFFGQEFRISESRRGDTAFFDPRVHAVVHYKGHQAFLINAMVDDKIFSEYSIGLFDTEGKKGTYTDAEDGVLSKNPIEHGSVDSVIGITFDASKKETKDIYYWIAAGRSIVDAHTVNEYVLSESPERLILSTDNYWHAWLEKESRDLSSIENTLQSLYKRSLAIIRVHSDNRGGIIASSDSDILNQGRDNYSYVWPRDAAINANALDRAGYTNATQRFFTFMSGLIEKDGYLMHKYRVDGVLGSSWHPWIRDGQAELPIQEDETALVVYMLWQHYQKAKDLEFLESQFNIFIEPAANFMCLHVVEETGLPKSSYDLWEEKYGTSTYTAATVYGALQAAAEMSVLLGKRTHANRYRTQAERIKKGILGYLYDADSGMFVKLVRHKGDTLEYDRTIDLSSFFGIFYFGILLPSDRRMIRARQVIEDKLKVPTVFGGYMRYEGDKYYKTAEDASPNAWCITTLWVAQFHILAAKKKKDLEKAHELLCWVCNKASESGILSEQIHPYTGGQLSTAPLVWSHAEFVITVDEYLKKFKKLSP